MLLMLMESTRSESASHDGARRAGADGRFLAERAAVRRAHPVRGRFSSTARAPRARTVRQTPAHKRTTFFVNIRTALLR